MLETIERLAYRSIARACGFAALAIVTFMIGVLAVDYRMMVRSCGYLTLIVALVLLLKAWGASTRPYTQTELWIMLHPAERPAKAIAQQVIGTVLREVYLRFALHAALLAAAVLALSAFLDLVRPR